MSGGASKAPHALKMHQVQIKRGQSSFRVLAPIVADRSRTSAARLTPLPSRLPGLVLGVTELSRDCTRRTWACAQYRPVARGESPGGEVDPLVLRDHPHQFLLDSLRRIALSEREPVGDAEDMGIDDDALRQAKAHAQHHVGSLASRAREQ